MNLKDRGNKKWTSLMLVEHKKRLRELKKKEKDLEKPELDEQLKEEIDFKLKKAFNNNLKVKLNYYHKKSFYEFEGRIKKIDSIKKNITIFNNKKAKEIMIENIIDLNLL